MSSLIWIVILLLSVLAALGLGAMVTFWTRKAFLGKRLQESEQKAQQVLENAERQKATMLLEAKEETLQARTAADQDIRERRGEVQQQERRLSTREENLERRFSAMEGREQGLADHEKALDAAHGEVEQLKQQQLVQLEVTAGLVSRGGPRSGGSKGRRRSEARAYPQVLGAGAAVQGRSGRQCPQVRGYGH